MGNRHGYKKCKIKQNLLIYAHYYYPDVASTGQILKDIAEGMRSEFNVTVICAVPSYEGVIEEHYKKKKYYTEIINEVNVVRVKVPEFRKTDKLSRFFNIGVYFFRAIYATLKLGHQDYIITISQPPILGGLLGVIGKSIKHAKNIYCIHDFNPEQSLAVGYSKSKLLTTAAMRVDKFNCKHADQVVVVGRDMIDTLKKRFKNKRVPICTFINNWIDEKEIHPLPKHDREVVAFRRRYGLEDKYVVMYSGNLGLYYDLENLIKEIKKLPEDTKAEDGRRVAFAFVGSGSIKEKLASYVEKHGIKNVVFIPYQDKNRLVYSLNACDCLLCISAAGIKGVSVPSKIYGIMAAGKPVLGILEPGSEARIIMEEAGCGLLSNPGDYKKFRENLYQFFSMSQEEHEAMGMAGRDFIVNNLTKEQAVTKYLELIMDC